MDGRRRSWFALDVWFASSRLALVLTDEFGRDGILTWIAYLAACKRAAEPGRFEYTTEAQGWDRLGLDYPEPPPFTLHDFFAFTGRRKQTRTLRVGRKQIIVCREWDRWQKVSRVRVEDAEGVLPEREFVPAKNGVDPKVGKVVTALAPVGQADPDRVAKLVAGFPDVDVLAEAAKLADWCAEKNIATKDVHARFRNWLGKAEKRKADVDYPVGAFK